VRVIERLPEFILQMKSEDWHWCCVADFGFARLMQGVDGNVHVAKPTEAMGRRGYTAPVSKSCFNKITNLSQEVSHC
jgi:hypothetical protein